MSASSSEHPSFRTLARYGVPAAILLYYLSVAQRLEYTPQSTFASLNRLSETGVDSLWTALLSLAQSFDIETLLAAKVLGLLFTCCAILVTHLVAYEVLADHLSAFCATLGMAMQAWLLQLGASGSGLSLLVFVSLAAIFFMLRNDYLLATLCAGFGCLVAWQAVALVFVLLLDVYVNSLDKRRALKLVASVMMIFGSIVLPWVLYSIYTGGAIIPDEASRTEVPTLTLEMIFGSVLLIGLMFVGVVLLAMRQRESLRTQTAVILWTVSVSFLNRILLVLALPLIIVYGFLALRTVVRVLGAVRALPSATVLLAAAILAYNQFVAWPTLEAGMAAGAAQTLELKSVGMWLKANVQAGERVFVPASGRDVVGYFYGVFDGDETAPFIVSREREVRGCEVAYDPAAHDPDVISGSDHYKVWRRR